MKSYKKIVYAVAVMIATFSCTENEHADFPVEKPESIAAVEYLNDYDVLKTYINRSENPNFKLGSIIGTSDFENKNTALRIIQSNFDEIAFSGTELFHNAVVDDDGKISLSTVNGWIESAKDLELSVFGHALCSNSNQNGVYLSKLIAPQVFIPENNVLDKSGLSENPYGGGWKESHDARGGSVSTASNGITGGSASISLTNGNNTTSASTRIQSPNIDRTQKIKKWLVSFCIKSSKAGKGRITLSNNYSSRYPFTFDANEGANSVFYTTTEWKQFQFVLDADASLMDTRRDTTSITFSIDVGYLANVKYEVDIQTFSMLPVESATIPEYTAFRLLNDNEKAEILTESMQTFVSTMMDTCKNAIRAWDVVGNPMSDRTPGDLISASEVGTGNSVFYWQEYLGKDYAVAAFKMARQFGNKNEKLFVADNNLFEKPAKLSGLVEYIQYIDEQGASVDGISTPLNVTLGVTDVEVVKDFFATLAATGKLVRISDLKVGMRRADGSANLNAGSLTNDEQKAMSDFYKEILAAYFEKVPAPQRYGITLRNPVDNADAIGLWSVDYSRKHTYAGFIEGLEYK